MTEKLKNSYWLTRIIYTRYLAFIFLIAFFVAFHQNEALIGEKGLTPAKSFTARYQGHFQSKLDAFLHHPTLFWYIEPTTSSLQSMSLVGCALSFFILLQGHGNMLMWFVLWITYMSICNIGQTWYSFGWESQLLETAFLMMFGVPLIGSSGVLGRLFTWIAGCFTHSKNGKTSQVEEFDARFPRWMRTPWVLIWGNRWLLFRIMLGAGLIKIRGDECWRDLTCMNYHYETQPNPHPLSIYFHNTPENFHKLETMVNHIIELVFPWFLLVPERNCQMIGGLVQILFQIILISTGNYAFLNWLTIAPALFCLDDAFWAFLFTQADQQKALQAEKRYRSYITGQQDDENSDKEKEKSPAVVSWLQHLHRHYFYYPPYFPSLLIFLRRMTSITFALLIGYLSYPVIINMASPTQVMNMNYDPFRIVNTYGLFGSITKVRHEVVLQGTSDKFLSDQTNWKEFEFRCKPGDINRTPCWITPYHLRIDWLMWFAAFQNYQQCPWIVHLSFKLLSGDLLANDLLDPSGNPFYNQTTLLQSAKTKKQSNKNLEEATAMNGLSALDQQKLLQSKAPKFIRAALYEYRWRNLWTNSQEQDEIDRQKGWEIGRYWKRKYVGLYLPPIEKENESVKQFLKAYGMI